MRTEASGVLARTVATHISRFILAGLVLAALTACGGGVGDEDSGVNVTFGNVAIQSPTTEPTYTTTDDSIYLFGSSFIAAANWGTHSNSGVSVSWTNAAGGSGYASESAEYCEYFHTVCNPTWGASIPLVIGQNFITVVATDLTGDSGRDSITVIRIPDTTSPTVSSTYPPNGAPSVAINTSISATFSELMEDASITSATFQVTDSNGISVPGTVTIAGNTAKFSPTQLLPGLTRFIATIASDARDLSGNAIAGPYSWTFATVLVPDTTPPSIVSTSPKSGSTCADIEATITATFDEGITESSMNSSTFALRDAAQNPVNSTVSTVPTSPTATIFGLSPLNPMSFSTTYTATLSSGIRDRAGNAMTTDYSWSFTTPPNGMGSWQPIIETGAPKRGYGQTAVWTGAEMIVWGGLTNQGTPVGTGGRYQPASETWIPISMAGAPSPRYGHVAIWTGSEMIVWGGEHQSDGAIYNPSTDKWRPMSAVGGIGDFGHTVVWTGSEMIYLVGRFGGARYNLASDSWSPVPPPPQLNGGQLENFTAVWTGSKVILWAKIQIDCDQNSPPCYSSGAAYDPLTNAWSQINSSNGLVPDGGATAVWTGTEMAVLGTTHGQDGARFAGALYNPQSDTWRSMSTSCGPSDRAGHTAVWDGTQMIVWGGSAGVKKLGSGATYSPATDSWQQISMLGAPSPRSDHIAIWTGSDMLIWGGDPGSTGGKYRP